MKKAGKKLRVEFLKTMTQLATAGFGLAAALAWNTAIQGVISRLLPGEGAGLLSQIIYAIIVTVIAVLVTYSLGKMLQEEGEVEEKKDNRE